MTTDATTRFFGELADRPYEPLLAKASGTVRFDLEREAATDRWLVTIDEGALSVSRRMSKADCVIRMDRAFFGEIASGRASAWSAALRGLLTVEGDVRLLLLLQRLFPGPHDDAESSPS